jgi:subtilase family serine protease
MRNIVRIVLTCVFAGAGSLIAFGQGSFSAPPRILQAVDESQLVQLTGNTHPMAQAQYDQGRADDNLNLEHMLLVLSRSPEQEAALATLISQLHDPQSANYHQWLTAEQFGERFGVSTQDIAVVTNWLQSHGLQVNGVYPNGLIIDVSGTAGQVLEAFHAEIHNYNIQGVQHIANANDPQIPAALAPVIVGFASLNSFMPHPLVHNAGPVQRNAKTGNWTPVGFHPDFSFSYSGSEQYDVAPQDFATIYNLTPALKAGYTGAGQTIVVIEDTNMKAADWTSFRAAFGLSSYTGTLAQVNPVGATATNNCANPGTNGDEIEAALDAEWAGAVAPNASIELASCKDTTTTFGGLIAAQNLLNSKTPPPIMSISYGECESAMGVSGNAAYKSTYQQAVTEGTSVYVASGDEGAASCDPDAAYATHGIAVSGFASTPYNVAVGGTDFYDYASNTISTYWNTTNATGYSSAKSYIPEMTWDDSCATSVLYLYEKSTSGTTFCNSTTGKADFLNDIGGSGGPSSLYAKPSWQANVAGIVSDGKRDIPDVSSFAANGLWTHALVFCMSDTAEGGEPCTYTNSTDTWYNSAGGTSFAAPAFAGIQALVNQKTGSKWGNPNTVLYSLAATEFGSAVKKNATTLSSCNASNGKSVGTSCIFHDVTEGDIDVACKGTTGCYGTSKTATYGVLSTSSTTLGVAYPATSGWDFATGLGTVNIFNLVSNW